MVIRLLTPTQDLVFARAIRITRSGGGFRGLTVEKTAVPTGSRGLKLQVSGRVGFSL
jgi:hypothetical protein